ncbi:MULTISPECIES: hypothetical protein [Leptospira]|uniref:Uncharacterized protein n=4 Tax=Leptospira weilii TaxID=28184 RepID=A0A828Z9M2_9LEPT|nr:MULTISPECIES: hypothetical protein [Leptospira]EKR66307.1 hypothetical protein LEP1GSC036_3941 [Leptospira weilii str. 2006001853]EMN90285.1 hypothetical protein LEP1GSC108_3579 [Leptospira weilii str. UI 13098]OMI12931.1 hypothetical protein BUQ74_21095 [Leptospira weilii serovar Heyan]QDK23894.1 hypothetical protein FHG67_15095 [Leptospira weilii]QDK26469.1 hypothetical protein FHG68_07165 [Leptospira weilii]
MVTEKDLTDKVIAKDILGWEFNSGVGWRTKANTVEERLPSFKTDARWTGLLWNIALPIMQKNHIGLEAGVDSIEVNNCFCDEVFTSSSINFALALIVLNKDEL